MVERPLARQRLRLMRQSLVVSLSAFRLTLVLLTGLVFSFPSAANALDPCNNDRVLPVRKVIDARFPAWHLVTLSMLSDEDQRASNENRGTECPGLAVGNFDGSGRTQYGAFVKFGV